MTIQIAKKNRTYIFNTNHVPNIILGPGNNWAPGTKLIDDFPFSPVPDSVLEVIENHINEGNLTHGKIDGYTWQIVKAHPKQKEKIRVLKSKINYWSRAHADAYTELLNAKKHLDSFIHDLEQLTNKKG